MNPINSIIGDVRPGEEFSFEKKPTNLAKATFVALVDGKLVVTRRAIELFSLPDETPILAHWHGNHRTDAFVMNVRTLKEKAAAYRNDATRVKPPSPLTTPRVAWP